MPDEHQRSNFCDERCRNIASKGFGSVRNIQTLPNGHPQKEEFLKWSIIFIDMLIRHQTGIKQARGEIVDFEKQHSEERELWSRSTGKKGAPVHLQMALEAVTQKITGSLMNEHLELIQKIKGISKVVEPLAEKDVQNKTRKSPTSAINKPWTKKINEGCIRCLEKSCEEHTRVSKVTGKTRQGT